MMYDKILFRRLEESITEIQLLGEKTMSLGRDIRKINAIMDDLQSNLFSIKSFFKPRNNE